MEFISFSTRFAYDTSVHVAALYKYSNPSYSVWNIRPAKLVPAQRIETVAKRESRIFFLHMYTEGLWKTAWYYKFLWRVKLKKMAEAFIKYVNPGYRASRWKLRKVRNRNKDRRAIWNRKLYSVTKFLCRIKNSNEQKNDFLNRGQNYQK